MSSMNEQGGEPDWRSGSEKDEDDSHLFIVRLWKAGTGRTGGRGHGEAPAEGLAPWHGRIQHVLRGESRPFAGWPQLLDCFESLMSDPHDPPRKEGDERC